MGNEYGELVPLGSGPMATVYAGVRAGTGEAVALKVFGTKLPKRVRTEVERELARLAPLRGAALVADALEDLGDHTALRMELCSQSLTELIAVDGPLSIADVVALGRSLAAALLVAHEAGIVHGGVTPGNVLFRPSGEPLLSDFGLTLRHAFPRDPVIDHTAPETLRDGTADERSDLYGLGVVLYLALSGSSPHPAVLGERPDDRVLRVLGSPVPKLARPDVPDGLVEIVAALLAKDPALRPGGIAVVAGWLDALAGAAPAPVATFDDFAPEAPRPLGEPVFETAPAVPRQGVRHAWPVLAGAGALLLVVGAGVLMLRSDPQVLEVLPTNPATAIPAPVPTRAVQLELVEPVDRADHVELSWRSSEQLEFVVVVAIEGEKEAKTIRAQQNRSIRIDVDPARQYCFLVQGTDGTAVYATQPKALRGAKCKL